MAKSHAITGDPRALDQAPTYTLREAAQVIGIDQKTLRRRLALIGIVPTADTSDHRKKLLSAQELRLLSVPSGSAWSAEAMAVDVVAAKERRLAEESAQLRQRERDLQATISKFETLVAAVTRGLAPKIDHLLAQSGAFPDGVEVPASSEGDSDVRLPSRAQIFGVGSKHR